MHDRDIYVCLALFGVHWPPGFGMASMRAIVQFSFASAFYGQEEDTLVAYSIAMAKAYA